MKVRCKKDFGYFKKDEVYSVQRMLTIRGISDSVWKIFFHDRDDGTGGARNILGSDLGDFFEAITSNDKQITYGL